ncbi:MAG TPA: hypothetical protein VEL78_01515 [Pyrinomonadaceae bacterium]|nr:hypothetical protein [Pyrinomonadaceae bacterium]
MTDQEYQRFENLLSTVIEQQATFAENQTKADARMTRHENSIASLLAIAELHERELADTNERLGTLINVVERYVSKEP